MGRDTQPADAQLADMRRPYSLLLDRLPAYEGAPQRPSSKKCFEADFQKRLEKTGNYRQMTNNYKRDGPDSCSAPNHELLLSFYKTDPLPFSGCL